jgi:membrane protein
MFYKTAISLLVLMAVWRCLFRPSPTWYLRSFARYNKTFGALGAVVALMLWFYVSAMAIILGAELNSEMLKSSVEFSQQRKSTVSCST